MRKASPASNPVSSTQTMVRLCPVNDLASGEARRFDVGDHRIAVVRVGDDVYAVGDRCTHQDVSLSEGDVDTKDLEIECVRHGSTFSLITGEALSLPATKPTPVYRVEVMDGDVHVEIGAISPQETEVTTGKDTELLDVRTLQPRDRHQTILERMGTLEVGEALRLVNDHDPIPLRYQLEAEFPEHYRWVSVKAGPERWVVDITSRARVFDARPTIAAGGEPFSAIMEVASSTGNDEVLVVYAPFEPIPLEGVLGEQGFEYVAEQIDEDTWRVRFTRR